MRKMKKQTLFDVLCYLLSGALHIRYRSEVSERRFEKSVFYENLFIFMRNDDVNNRNWKYQQCVGMIFF